MTGTDLSDLRERCIRHALTLHPNQTVHKPNVYSVGGGYGSDLSVISPPVDTVLATAEKIFQFCLKWGGDRALVVTDRELGPQKRKHRRRRIAPAYGAAVRKGKRK